MSPSFSSCSTAAASRPSSAPRRLGGLVVSSSACASSVCVVVGLRLVGLRLVGLRLVGLRFVRGLGRVLGHGLVSLGFFFGWVWPPDFFCCGGFPPVFFWGWLPPVCLRCWRDCFFGCWRWRGSLRPRPRAASPPAAPSTTPCLAAFALSRSSFASNGRRARRRVVADHVELLAHGPQVRGGPVEEDADRERDATDGEDHRQHVEQHLLLLGVRAGQRVRRHVLAHQLTLGEERGRRHREHQERRGDHHRDVAVGVEEGVRERDDPEQLGVAELLGLLGGQDALRGAVRGVVEQPEQREEDRHLQQDRQARGERVGPALLVELHRLLGETLPVVAVLLLQLLDLRLDQLHVAAGLDLLDEQRDQRGPDDDGQPDDRQRPRRAARPGPGTC